MNFFVRSLQPSPSQREAPPRRCPELPYDPPPLHAPLYCCLCAAPCLLDRIPPPAVSSSGSPIDAEPLEGSDTVDCVAPVSGSGSGSGSGARARGQRAESGNGGGPDWLRQWHVLCCAYGLLQNMPEIIVPGVPACGAAVHSTPPDFSSSSSSFSAVRDPTATDLGLYPSAQSSQFRLAPIHHYCLSTCLRLLRTGPSLGGPRAADPKQRIVPTWSLPRWTGRGPWVREGRVGYRNMPDLRGVWRGTDSQLLRWDRAGGREGGHLVKADLVSPVCLPPPRPTSRRVPARQPVALSMSESLPTSVLSQIALELVPPDCAARPSSECPPEHEHRTVPFCPDSSAQDLLSLLRTCTTLRHIPLPSRVWESLSLSALRGYQSSLLLGASLEDAAQKVQLELAMEREFEAELLGAQRCAQANEKRLRSEEWARIVSQDGGAPGARGELEYTTRDVFYWFAYDEAWRSRRRVWSAVLQGTAIAKLSGWR